MGKALLVTNDFPPMLGGEATWYAQMCAAAPAERVLVLAPRMPGDEAFDARQPYRIARRRAPLSPHPAARLLEMLILCLAALGMIRRERVDTVHLGHLYLGPIGLVLKRLRNVPYVLYLHGGEMAPYMRFRAIRWMARAVVLGAGEVVMNSDYTRQHFEGLGVSLPHAEVVAPPVDVARFRPECDGASVRRRLGLGGAKMILTVGRVIPRKGHDAVIRALTQIRPTVGPVRYVIAGTGPDEARLRALAEELGCAGDVIFAGRVPDDELPALYAACDVFAMPSRVLAVRDGIEGFGLVFLEAGACGKATIGGRSGGIADAIVDGVTGILVDPLDVDDLASALTRLLLSPDLAAQMGSQGRRRALDLAASSAAVLARVWAAPGAGGGLSRGGR